MSLFGNQRVLVVDDEESIRATVRGYLTPQPSADLARAAWGLEVEEGSSEEEVPHFEIREAAQGEVAVEMVRAAAQSGDHFAVAFVDMQMPPGMDGIETIRQIREIDQHIYLVVITAQTDYSLEEMRAAAGYRLFLMRKPFTRDELLQAAWNSCMSWQRDKELRQLQERREYQNFQQGIAEMGTTILHNIGNAITGVRYRAEQIGAGVEEVIAIGNKLSKLQQVVAARREQLSSDQLLDQLSEIVVEVGEQLEVLGRERFRGRSAEIVANVDHISDIIRIQQAAAHPASAASSFNVEHLIQDVLMMQEELLEKYRVTLSYEVDRSLPEVRLPRNQLLQLFVNAVKNSVESIKEKRELKGAVDAFEGQIEITVVVLQQSEEIESRKVRQRSGSQSEGIESRKVRQLQFSVTDNGVGVEAERISSLFRFGESSKQRGSGFGLHSAANFINALNGSIALESDGVGEGATLRWMIPVEDQGEEE